MIFRSDGCKREKEEKISGKPRRISRKAQKTAAAVTGIFLTVLCCLLAERYARGGKKLSEEAAVSVLSSGASAGEVLILSYHQVLPTDEDVQKAAAAGEEYAISLSVFKQDLLYLSEQTSFVLPQELKKAAQGLYTLPEKSVMLTFDGGYRSFYTVVWPQLRESGGKGGVGILGEDTELYSGSLDSDDILAKLSWNQVRQMDRSDCVEIISMGYRLYPESEKAMKESGADKGFLRFSSLAKLLKLDLVREENAKKGQLREEYLQNVGADVLLMGESLRSHLYHEADAVMIPYGYGGEETDLLMEESGMAVTLLAGEEVSARQLAEYGNVIYGRDSLKSLKRVIRPNTGTLSELLSEYFEDRES